MQFISLFALIETVFINSVFVDLEGDLERKFDLEISPLCDQQTDSVPAIQIGKSCLILKTVSLNSPY